MRYAAWFVVLLFLTGACGARDSGVEGRVTAGPTCPVVQIDMPCPDQPYAATLTFLLEGSRFRVAQVTANEDGYYRAYLAPGTYVIRPESPGILPFASEVVVVVRPHEFTRQDIVYDTGFGDSGPQAGVERLWELLHGVDAHVLDVVVPDRRF